MMQIRKESWKNMQEYKEAPCKVDDKNKIGQGGNGIVGLVSDCEKKIVIKIFKVNKKIGKAERDKRYHRFCKEIEVQKELSCKIDGVLSVYDFSFPEEFSEKNPAWYTMPKAEKFVLQDGLSLIEKLKRMLELGKILSEIHKKGIAHRDLKPEKLLIFNGRIYLADYGLVWISGEESITHQTERLGPIKIMPPELEAMEELRRCDYKKSDVYLFSKVVWMYINENNHGYRGEYSRTDSQRKLDIKSDYGKTFEPLHQMMERSTKYDWSKRPSIDESMELLRHQILILMGEFPEEQEKEYFIKEKVAFYKAHVTPDIEVYETGEKISTFLHDMLPFIRVKIKKEQKWFDLCPYSVKMPQEKLFVFSEEIFGGNIRRYVMHIQRLEIASPYIKVIVKKLNRHEKDSIEKLNVEVFAQEDEGGIILK